MNGLKRKLHLKCIKGDGYRFTVTKSVNHMSHLPGDKLSEDEVRIIISRDRDLKVVINDAS